jgi:16S rRNA (guanine(1405)-N(7))-methyltransferase
MKEPLALDDVVAQVMSGPKYRSLHPALVERIARQELAKGRNLKETIKAVRNKLHQVGGAYQESEIDYARWITELAGLPADPSDPALQAYCRHAMTQHASTHERLPFIERFYAEILAPIAPVESVLDLACGLNPLALPWMPLAPGARYDACDIYRDQVEFLNAFLARLNHPGEAFLCDLVAGPPARPAQLALLLKTIPCLEQVDKAVGERLLDAIQAEYLLVSFPARSLGGRSKGMVENYEARFNSLIAGRGWQITRYEFPTELAFFIRR